MRILPIFNANSNIANNFNKSNNTQLQGWNTVQSDTVHNYTGNVSADLAYASMVDDSIAKDLRSINLIG